ncbi:MAG: methyltransferase domain-containing protein [Planctomycetota bacterium]
MTEIALVRAEIEPWLQGCVVDLGCGRNKVAPHAIGVDLSRYYGGKLHRGRVRTIADIPSGWEAFYTFCAEHKALFDTVFSSHLLENYVRPYAVLARWLHLVRVGGRLIVLLPIEQKYRRVTKKRRNRAHKSEWAGATDFLARMPGELAKRLSTLYAEEEIGRWSFMVVFQRDS